MPFRRKLSTLYTVYSHQGMCIQKDRVEFRATVLKIEQLHTQYENDKIPKRDITHIKKSQRL